MKTNELKAHMQQCTGTTQYHKLTLMPLLATDGVKMVAEKAGAFWLIESIASYQVRPSVKELAIQFWTLEVSGGQAELYCLRDSGRPKIVHQKIEYTDFPEGSWNFYVQNGVMMLPQEY